jgi:hypothetical protein
MAVDLRDRIHSDFSTGSGVWSDYRRQITGAYIDDKGAGVNYGDYTNHLIREYNDKITDLNQPSELYIEPFDAGFRYKINPVTATYNSGIAAAFSARTVGLGAGPLLRLRRSNDNTEVDVRGDKDGVLSLSSPIIDYRENLVRFSETFSSWNSVTSTLTASQSDPFGGTDATLFESERVEFDFSSSAGWTVGTNWAINTTNGLATRTGGGSGTNLAYAAWTLESGKTYKVIIDVKTLDDETCNVYDATNGVTYKAGGAAGTFTSVGDNQSFTFTATATGAFALRSSSNNLAVTNLTIMEVLGTARREILTTVVANQTYNGSVFVKAGTSDNFQIQFVDHLASYASRGLLKVDVAADGSFSTATATSISNVTYAASSNGFTRVSFSFTPSASSTQLSMRLFPDRDNGLDNTIFFGAQLSNGQTVEKYIKTSGSIISELDRPQETLRDFIGIQNLLPFSEDLSEWSADGITATEIAGDNALNDDGFYRVTASAGSKTITETTETNTPAIAAGDVFTASVYVKNVSVAGGVVKLQLTRDAGGDYEQAEVILNNTTDEWQRFTVTHTFAQAHTRLRVRLLTSSALSSLSADVFGFQLVKGSSAGTYTKTIGTPNEANGFVTAWYDQSAVGSDQKNFQQATASYQPLVVENGDLITGANNKPGVRWDVGKSMYINSQFTNGKIDTFFVSDFDVSDATANSRKRHIWFTSTGTSNYIIMDSGSTSTSIGSLGNVNKTLRVNGVDYDPNDPELTRSGVFQLLDGNKLYSTVGGNSATYTGTHDNILNLGFYNSDASSTFNFEGLMQETIIYTGDQLSTRTGIETEMNNYYNMF